MPSLDQIADAMRAITPATQDMPPCRREAAARLPALLALRERCLKLGADLPWAERGAILTLLGSAERAFYLIERIDAERRSVSRAPCAPAVAARRGSRCRGSAGRRRLLRLEAEDDESVTSDRA